jgi:hypothetical protein
MMYLFSIVAAAPPISVPQFIISIVLFFVLLFGIGFILNMILKTTWVPLVVYLGVVVYLVYDLQTPHVADFTILGAGLLGAGGSGWTIQTLRTKGYRMF